MKKILKVTFLCVICTICFYAYSAPQAYRSIRIKERTSTDYESADGIQVSISYEGNNYNVKLFNSNFNDPNDYTTYTFKWYLCYQGKRVSDYYSERMGCRKTETRQVYAWPDKVPSGYEKYVTVQFGTEPEIRIKDYRDDDIN